MNYFRLQDAGISLEEMQAFTSFDGGDGGTIGLCVSDRPDTFGGAEGAYGPDRAGEVLVLKGVRMEQIYDGYRIRPTTIVARFSWQEWKEKIADESAWDYEDWS